MNQPPFQLLEAALQRVFPMARKVAVYADFPDFGEHTIIVSFPPSVFPHSPLPEPTCGMIHSTWEFRRTWRPGPYEEEWRLLPRSLESLFDDIAARTLDDARRESLARTPPPAPLPGVLHG